jgi:hypothetical protein
MLPPLAFPIPYFSSPLTSQLVSEISSAKRNRYGLVVDRADLCAIEGRVSDARYHASPVH